MSKDSHGQGNDLGYGKSAQDATMGNPQPSSQTGQAVGEGSETKWRSVPKRQTWLFTLPNTVKRGA